MTTIALRLTVALLALSLLNPTSMQAATPAKSEQAQDVPVKSVIDPQRLSDITRTLSSDEFEGRAPGTAGERKAIA